MAQQKVKVGFAGLSAVAGSWAEVAHVSHFQEDGSNYELVALVNSDKEKAKAAANKFKVAEEKAYGTIGDLVQDKDVDLVVVSVKVPEHYDLVKPALENKKPVFCEWPLGRTLKEAEELALLADKNNLTAMVGLQARQLVSVRLAKKLIAEGKIGKVLSVTLIGGCGTGAFAPNVLERNQYLSEINNGAHMITIPVGHTVDALLYILDTEFSYLTAVVANQFPEVNVIKSWTDPTVISKISKNTFDQLAVSGLLENGAVVSIHYRSGLPEGTDTGLHLEINGTKGTLLLKGPGGNMQVTGANIELISPGGQREDITPTNAEKSPTVAVAEEYREFAKGEKGEYPDFKAAVVRHRMVDAIMESASTGNRTSYKTKY